MDIELLKMLGYSDISVENGKVSAVHGKLRHHGLSIDKDHTSIYGDGSGSTSFIIRVHWERRELLS